MPHVEIVSSLFWGGMFRMLALVVISILGGIVALIGLVTALFRKRTKKKWALSLLACFVVFIASTVTYMNNLTPQERAVITQKQQEQEKKSKATNEVEEKAKQTEAEQKAQWEANKKDSIEKTTQQPSESLAKDTLVREYQVLKVRDISIKALGNKQLSSYSASELNELPMNIRKEYRVFIPPQLTKEEVTATLRHLVDIESRKNNDIDEIAIFAYDNKDEFNGYYTVGKLEWCPDGNWGGVTPEIASSNNRSSYEYVIDISDTYLNPKTSLSIGTKVKLQNKNSKTVDVSSKKDSWGDDTIIVRVPNGTQVTIMDIAKFISPGLEMIRYNIKVNYSGKVYTGWVHEWDVVKE